MGNHDSTPDDGIIVRIGRAKYETTITARGHALTADEPAHLGGANRGPTPYDLLLASLGACTAITLRMYADRKEWPMHSVRVSLSQQRRHARDCEDCESNDGHVTEISRTIQIEGDLTDEQRQRLMEIADRCPVHRSLSSEIKIRTHAG